MLIAPTIQALILPLPSLPYPVLQMLGWVLFFSYIGVAIMAWWCTIALSSPTQDAQAVQRVSLWRFLGVFLLLMAINKQLDLHGFLYDFLREASGAEGYGPTARQFSHLVAVALIAGIGTVMALWLASVLAEAIRNYRLALTGVCILLIALCIRIMSLKAFLNLTGWQINGWTYNWLLESIALVLITLAARQTMQNRSSASDDLVGII